ncbi:MmyB family transcriptional regulator, partial [Streptomyces albogriseolus]
RRASRAPPPRLWDSHDVSADSALSKTFQHPVVGPVTVNCDVLDITDRDQQVVIYTAEPGSPSAEALQLLSVIGARHTTGPARPARRPSPSPQSCST